MLDKFPIQIHLHSNGDGSDLHAIGAIDSIALQKPTGAWEQADKFIQKHAGKFIFSAFSYELKDDTEALHSNNPQYIKFPSLFLFVPQVVLTWEMGEIEVIALYDRGIHIQEIKKGIVDLYKPQANSSPDVQFNSLSQEKYIEHIQAIKNHIQLGDIYEMNFCQEFRAKEVELDPHNAFQRLLEKTKAPYSCHLKINDLHLLCASPELFLEKTGSRVVSKPIKGTRKRSSDPVADQRLKEELQKDLKERAENIMICDLVRNDLSQTALSDSVRVEELCEVYSFETVHQMISTVTSQVSDDMNPLEIIRKAFPMGSMTGAPKIESMKLIEQYEDFKRGIYSGAVGYFTPDRDFTFNVVIRSILYNAQSKLATICAGGAITALSDPQLEYEESLLKARAMMEVVNNQ